MKTLVIAFAVMMAMTPFVSTASESDYLFDKVNSVRSTDLIYNVDLENRAQEYADDLCASGKFTTKNWTNYISGLTSKVGVNLAKDFRSDSKMFKKFEKDANTRSNIHDTLFDETGIARNDKCNIVIQFFN